MTLQTLTHSGGYSSHADTEFSMARRVRLSDGRILAFSEYGVFSGYPLFYVHDAGSSRLEAVFFHAEARRKGFRLIAVDRPGIGESAALSGFSRQSCADDILQLADAMRFGRFGILSAGSGTAIALELAALAPQRVTMLLGLSSQLPVCSAQSRLLCNVARSLFGLLLQSRVGLRLWLRGTSAERYVQRLGETLSFADRRMLENNSIRENLIRIAAEAVKSGGAGIARDAVLALAPIQISKQKLLMPVHLWQGGTESAAVHNAHLKFAESLPAGKLHRLNNRGHYFFWRHCEEVFAVAQSVVSSAKQLAPSRQERLAETVAVSTIAMAG